jgi:tetratricopeptide (TPR) repeat protein
MEYEMGLSAASILLAEGRADSALRLSRSLRLPPNPTLFSPSTGYFNLGVRYRHRYSVAARACLALGDTLGAVRELEQQVREYPDRPDFRLINPLLHFDLAVLLDRIGADERARQQYTEFLRILAKAERDSRELRHARERVRQLTRAAPAT